MEAEGEAVGEAVGETAVQEAVHDAVGGDDAVQEAGEEVAVEAAAVQEAGEEVAVEAAAVLEAGEETTTKEAPAEEATEATEVEAGGHPQPRAEVSSPDELVLLHCRGTDAHLPAGFQLTLDTLLPNPSATRSSTSEDLASIHLYQGWVQANHFVVPPPT